MKDDIQNVGIKKKLVCLAYVTGSNAVMSYLFDTHIIEVVNGMTTVQLFPLITGTLFGSYLYLAVEEFKDVRSRRYSEINKQKF